MHRKAFNVFSYSSCIRRHRFPVEIDKKLTRMSVYPLLQSCLRATEDEFDVNRPVIQSELPVALACSTRLRHLHSCTTSRASASREDGFVRTFDSLMASQPLFRIPCHGIFCKDALFRLMTVVVILIVVPLGITRHFLSIIPPRPTAWGRIVEIP